MNMNRVARIAALAAWAALAITGTPGMVTATAAAQTAGEASADPFDQATFPCQEDEVLGSAPEFGPDRVGCIHFDALKG